MNRSSPMNEKTTMIYDMENAISYGTKFLQKAKERIDVFTDRNGPSLIVKCDVYKANYIKARSRGAYIRFITEITKDNINYCKELKKIVDELRHLDDLKGSVSLSEIEFIGSSTWREKNLLIPVIYSSEKEIVEQQQFLFESLWNKAIPGEHKIKGIEEGQEQDIDVIKYPTRTLDLYLNIVKSAQSEILLMLPTPKAFIRQLKAIDLAKQASKERKVKVRILTPKNGIVDKYIKSFFEEEKQENPKQSIPACYNSDSKDDIKFRFIERMSDTKATILVIDKKDSLVMELRDDTKDTSEEAIGLSIYSNSKPGVLSYVAIFENLWKQTELIDEINMRNKELEKSSKELSIKEEELTSLVNKLVNYDNSKDEFIAMISHELKTPLVPLKGYAEMLLLPKKLGEINEKQKKVIQSIKRNTEKLESLVTDILEGYMIGVNKVTLSKKRVLTSDLLTDVINDLKPLAEEKQVSIVSEINTEIGDTIYCDEKRIGQVLSNLIRNAIDFVSPKEGKIIISVAREKQLRKENDGHYDKCDMTLYFVFAVEDNGIGIPKDKIDSLFDRFYQIDTSFTRKHGGIGLGLVICKGYVEAHGGRIWIDKTCTKGTCVKFALPVLTGQAT